ncbi:MAG: L-seryl-tRNA(Sec) selenium transferase [Acidobacteriota bacterium]
MPGRTQQAPAAAEPAPHEALRRLPQVDRALSSPELSPLLERFSRRAVAEALRDLLAEMRREVLAGELRLEAEASDSGGLLAAIRQRLEPLLEERARPFYRRVINATGVILHTGLGRAPLPEAATRALGELAPYPQRVEIDLESGERGGRDGGCARLIERLTGCEAATVVNNNAAATLVILAALARGRGVLLSRGEMVEIGGSYRIPTIMEESGARLIDVGTTNRTHERDYREAITEDVGMILKVHTSNYRVMGFTREVELETLVEIGREHGLPVVHDMGSGGLIDLARRGRPGEAMVRDSIAAGVDLVCFSGDKLVGGPQAGLIAGRREAGEKCRRHPLFRTIRPGRLVYTALEATLRLYLDGEDAAVQEIPTLRRLLGPAEELRHAAEASAARLSDLAGLRVRAVETRAQAGSGSLPAHEIPSWGLELTPEGALSASRLAAGLRRGEPSILARIQGDSVLLDLRTLGGEGEELAEVETRLRKIAADAADPRATC